MENNVVCVKLTGDEVEEIIHDEDRLRQRSLTAWKIARKVNFVLSHYQGKVLAVYAVNGYKKIIDEKGKHRRDYYDYGTLDLKLTSEFEHRDTAPLTRRGVSNPVSFLSENPLTLDKLRQKLPKRNIQLNVNNLPNKGNQNMEEYIDLLQANHNLILTGAPGTGKTYLAKQIAKEIGAETEFVQFHPSYDYTDFVEGLRPSTKDGHGQITFERQDGTFMAFCKRAAEDSEQKYVFIIDEINRAEPSRVFGELFFALEPSYRGTAGTVTTQYANLAKGEAMPGEKKPGESLKPGEFYVPENVYIIGTMNDIDRSVDSIDFAMRRRFVWKEISAEERMEAVLKDLPDDPEQSDSWRKAAIRGLECVNAYIDDKLPQLGKAYHIGPAYMLKLKSYAARQENGSKWVWEEYNISHKVWSDIWNLHLQPLLAEYLRGMPDLQNHLIGLEEAYWDGYEVNVSGSENTV